MEKQQPGGISVAQLTLFTYPPVGVKLGHHHDILVVKATLPNSLYRNNLPGSWEIF